MSTALTHFKFASCCGNTSRDGLNGQDYATSLAMHRAIVVSYGRWYNPNQVSWPAQMKSRTVTFFKTCRFPYQEYPRVRASFIVRYRALHNLPPWAPISASQSSVDRGLNMRVSYLSYLSVLAMMCLLARVDAPVPESMDTLTSRETPPKKMLHATDWKDQNLRAGLRAVKEGEEFDDSSSVSSSEVSLRSSKKLAGRRGCFIGLRAGLTIYSVAACTEHGEHLSLTAITGTRRALRLPWSPGAIVPFP